MDGRPTSWPVLGMTFFYLINTVLAQDKPEVRFALVQSNAKQAMLLNRESQRVFRDAINSFAKDRLDIAQRVKFRDPFVVSLDGILSPFNILSTVCEKLLPNRVNALIYVSYDEESKIDEANAIQYLFQLSSFLQIPVISWQAGTNERTAISDDLLVIQMAPTIFHQAEAVYSILERYKWNQFVVITAKTSGDSAFINAMRQGREKSKLSRMRLIATVKIDSLEPAAVLRELKPLVGNEARVFVLFASKKAATLIFQTSVSLGLVGSDFMWICTQKVIGDMTEKNWPPPPEFPVGILGIDIEMTEYNLVKTVNNAIKVYGRGFDHLLKSRVIPDNDFLPNITCERNDTSIWSVGRDFFKAMREISVPLGRMAEPRISFAADGSVNYARFNITNLSIGPNKFSKVWQTVGSWDSKNGLDISDITWPGNSPAPPRGRPEKFHLNVATIDEDPFVIMKIPDVSGKCELRSAACRRRPLNWTVNSTDEWVDMCCTGLCIDLLERLGSDIGFSFTLSRVEDGEFGRKLLTGQWTGLIGELIKKKSHLAFSSVKVTKERQNVIAFSTMYLETGIGIVVAKREGAISPTAFLEPFDYLTWLIMIVACIQVVAVFIFFLEWLSPYGLDPGAESRFSFFRMYWLVFAIFFGATVPVTVPRAISAKFVSAFWACCSFVFVAVYTANLATFMITRDVAHDIKGIEDRRFLNPYSEQPPFRFGTMPFGSTAETIREAYPQIYSYMQKNNRSSVKQGIEAVKNGQLDAFLYDATVLEYRVGSDQDCKILTVGSWFATTGYAIGFPQGSEHLAAFDEQLLRYQRTGFLEQVQRFWLTGACGSKRAKGQKENNKSSHALGVKNFTSAFIFLGVGVISSWAFLLFEFIYTQCIRFGFCQPLLGCRMCHFLSVNFSRSITLMQRRKQEKEHPNHDADVQHVRDQVDETKKQLKRLEKMEENLKVNPVKMTNGKCYLKSEEEDVRCRKGGLPKDVLSDITVMEETVL